MAKFICILKNERKEKLTADLINKHIEHLKYLKAKGILFLCGLLKNNAGGMLILEAGTYKEAEAHILQDPLMVNNCYEDYLIYELVEANEENNYLQDS